MGPKIKKGSQSWWAKGHLTENNPLTPVKMDHSTYVRTFTLSNYPSEALCSEFKPDDD